MHTTLYNEAPNNKFLVKLICNFLVGQIPPSSDMHGITEKDIRKNGPLAIISGQAVFSL